MSNYTKDAIEFAFNNKLSDMQDSIQDAISSKIADALEAKKVEVAQGMFGVAESWDNDEDDDVARADRELARMKAKPIKAANIDTEKDKIKKSKKDKEEEMDESVEELEELSKDTLKGYVNKRQWSMGSNENEQKKLERNLARADKKIANKEANESYIEEISKKTLGSYVKKAASDIDSRWYWGPSKNEFTSNRGTDSAEEKHSKKIEGRIKGIGKATDKLTKESYIEEKLDASMGVKKYIDDFIKSDNPKFEGKSKKERIQMALGAYYSAKKGKTRNEEVEELEELSKKTLGSYVKKAASDAGDKAYAAGMAQGDSILPSREAVKNTDKELKRQKGIGKAINRLTKED